MATYSIFEGNMERLQKKLTTIRNKCAKYGCSFSFKEIGEEVREVETDDNKKKIARFVIIDAEGTAQLNGWEFIASVEHTEKGNIFHSASQVEIPSRYYDCAPYCEHCQTSRYRKHAYIVRNTESGEFKQVGRGCLRDFTCGLSAEAVAQYLSWFEELATFESVEGCGFVPNYLPTEEILRYCAETVRKFGYIKRGSDQEPTASKVMGFYDAKHGHINYAPTLRAIEDEMWKVNFDPDSSEAVEEAKAVREWIAQQDDSNTYFHNLKVACALDHTSYKNLGLICSVFPAHFKALETEAARKEREQKAREAAEISKHVGNIGERISFSAKDVRCLTSWEGQFGTTYVYKLIDVDGNEFTWKTSKYIEPGPNTIKVTGTVKEHSSFRGVNQTELTRCKIA